MQGCPLRCLYCHNPDTWDVKAKLQYEMSPEELLAEVLRYRSFIAKGGITVTGGEPLLQAEFLKEFFALCRREKIHTALDTSGCIFNEKVKELLHYTDLILLDIKSLSRDMHQKITEVAPDHTLQTLGYLKEQNIPVWIRHVVVPGLTDNDSLLKELAAYLTSFPNIEKVELLPYHTMGISKYEQLGMEYPLKDTEPLGEEALTRARELFASYKLPLYDHPAQQKIEYMATFGSKVIAFNRELSFTRLLPENIAILNPFQDNPEINRISEAFYNKFYNDERERRLILGINPGRLGAGVTGIPFTDSKRMSGVCGINIESVSTHEPSSVFVCDVIKGYGEW